MSRPRIVATAGATSALLALAISTGASPATAMPFKSCNGQGVCLESVSSKSTTKSKSTTTTTTTTTPGTTGAPVWNPGAGSSQQADLPARALTAAEKLAIKQAGVQRDIYGAVLPAGCGGPPPAAPCPEAPAAPAAAPVQQAGAPGAPAKTVTTTTVTLEEVIEQAKAKIKLPKPTIGSAPCTGAGCKGTVGVPTWFWLDGSEWQERSDSASAGGHSVTVTAKPSKVVWNLGDGQSVTCTGPGTQYVESMGWASSPDCGLPNGYKKAGSYTVTADITYDVTVSGDANETEAVTRSSSEDITVREIQVVIK